jgi:pimeloyl-ACP methyl ester carboxylesterase
MAVKIPPLGEMVSVGTHSLHVIKEGSNGPTIVFDHGAGGSALTWSLVYPEIAKIAKVLIYDRAGYGWSESGPMPRTNEQCVEELHELLKNIKGPVILAGHSYGGINVRLYKQRYPENVKGIVLVDATHEDEITDRFPVEHQKGQQMPAKMMGVFVFLSKIGVLKALAACKAVPGFSQSIHNCPANIQKMLWKTSFQTRALVSAQSEFTHLPAGYEEVRHYKSLGDIPLTVISAGVVDQFIPGTSKEVQEQIKQTLKDVALDMSKMSSKGKLVIAEKSGHTVQLEEPEVVIQAIKEMVREIEG